MFKKFLNIFGITKKDSDNHQSPMSLLIGLNKDYEIDLSVSLSYDNNMSIKNPKLYAQKCAEFLYTINSGGLQIHITEILLDSIKNKDNQSLIENIIIYLTLLNKSKDNSEKEYVLNKAVIKPTQVFAKYINKINNE